VESSCECDNEPSGSIKCWEIIEWLHNWLSLGFSSSAQLHSLPSQRSRGVSYVLVITGASFVCPTADYKPCHLDSCLLSFLLCASRSSGETLFS
jgi:hypothetical protein